LTYMPHFPLAYQPHADASLTGMRHPQNQAKSPERSGLLVLELIGSSNLMTSSCITPMASLFLDNNTRFHQPGIKKGAANYAQNSA